MLYQETHVGKFKKSCAQYRYYAMNCAVQMIVQIGILKILAFVTKIVLKNIKTRN